MSRSARPSPPMPDAAPSHGMAAVEVILFDLDGTLIDTRSLYLESYRRALEPFLGRRLTDREIFELKPRSERRWLRDQVGEADAEACIAEFDRCYEALHADRFGGEFPGVADMLRSLRRDGYRLGLVTGKSRRSWSVTAAAVDLDVFDVAIFEDDAPPKPDPGGIRAALARLDVPPSGACYIGDTGSDLAAAATAGVLPVAALWGWPPDRRDRLRRIARRHGAPTLDRPADLPSTLRASRS